MYAIVKTGGKQYRVAEGDVIEVEKLESALGDEVRLAAVKTLFSEWASGMRAQAGKAQNPELKKALTDYAAGLDKVNSQINGIGDLDKLGDLNNGDIETATDRILAICG